jgi:hypothetical protein
LISKIKVNLVNDLRDCITGACINVALDSCHNSISCGGGGGGSSSSSCSSCSSGRYYIKDNKAFITPLLIIIFLLNVSK